MYKPLLKNTVLYLTKYVELMERVVLPMMENQARRFFSQKYGEIIVGDKHKNAIHQLYLNLSIILQVISSEGQVDYEKLEVLNKQTSILIAFELPWVNINFTLHGVLHHSAKLIYSKKGWSIGSFQKSSLKVKISLWINTCNNMPEHHPQFYS